MSVGREAGHATHRRTLTCEEQRFPGRCADDRHCCSVRCRTDCRGHTGVGRMRRQPAADHTHRVGIAEYDGVLAFVRGARCVDVVTHLPETTTPAPSAELTPHASPAPPASSPAIQQSEPTFLYCENGTAIYSDQSYVVGDPRCPQPTANEDPHGRDYQCDAQGTNCTYPDGSPVPGYRRCGTQCGEAPTSGEVQRKWMECIAVRSVEQCRAEQ